ncbi:hypothetical protein PCASD_23940 [Puccinia coronata f. sp. avenae]|uniref:Uncharacterized protein n=2 Tax=Puccinia coronata f. sp. avenae TaxID=200324 RepID=A0A2N5SJT8_9BASI|nr:hypothetical protein PCASD_23940 [Puccinia coronata f. sp. avenae]
MGAGLPWLPTEMCLSHLPTKTGLSRLPTETGLSWLPTETGLSRLPTETGLLAAHPDSWYQPSEQAYLLAKLVPAQQAGLPARRAGTSPASRPTCSPSWYQPSGQVLLLTTGLSRLPGGACTPLDDRDRRVIKRRKPPLDDRYRPVIKRSAYSSQQPGRTGHQEECVLLSMTGTDRPSRGGRLLLMASAVWSSRGGMLLLMTGLPGSEPAVLAPPEKYQPDELVDLLAGLVQVSARARRSNCLLGWYRYQLGKPVDLLAELVTVPGQRAGHGGVNTTMTVHRGVDTSMAGHGGVDTSMTGHHHGDARTSMAGHQVPAIELYNWMAGTTIKLESSRAVPSHQFIELDGGYSN